MTRLRLLPLLLLLLTACGAVNDARSRATANAAGQGRAARATPELISVELATDVPSAAQPNYQATIDADNRLQIGATKTHEAHDLIIAQYTAVAFSAYSTTDARRRVDSLTAQAVSNEQFYLRLTQGSEQATQTKAAPMEAATAAALDAQAKNAPFLAVIWPIVAFIGSLAGLIIASMFAYLLLRPRQVAADDEAEDCPIDTAGIVVNHSTGTASFPAVMQYTIPDHIANATQIEIIANVFARDGYPLSHANFTPSWRGFSEGGWKRFQDFLCNKTPYAEWIDATNHQRGFNVVDGFKQFLKQYITDAPRPTEGELSQTDHFQPVGKQTDIDTDTNIPGRGVSEAPASAPKTGAETEG